MGDSCGAPRALTRRCCWWLGLLSYCSKAPYSPLGGRKERSGSVSGWQVASSSLVGQPENLGRLLCLDSALHWSKGFAKDYLVLVRRFQKQRAFNGILVLWRCIVSLGLYCGRENHQLRNRHRNRHPDIGQHMYGYLCSRSGLFQVTCGLF